MLWDGQVSQGTHVISTNEVGIDLNEAGITSQDEDDYQYLLISLKQVSKNLFSFDEFVSKRVFYFQTENRRLFSPFDVRSNVVNCLILYIYKSFF